MSSLCISSLWLPRTDSVCTPVFCVQLVPSHIQPSPPKYDLYIINIFLTPFSILDDNILLVPKSWRSDGINLSYFKLFDPTEFLV